ncbi:uncharacterized protein LOC132273703 [Cornus florida]|uniref:uncharacterized protein LOC132273703 n=1 Tax=Cornus florida TaxID=4283 RepID=UPI0028A09869|nr:uncharacterized protein LOC132273703 [Cornus florida]
MAMENLDFIASVWRMLSSSLSWYFSWRRNTPPYLLIPASKVTADDDDEETAMAPPPSSDYLFCRLANKKLFRVKNGRSVLPDDAKCLMSSHGWLAFLNPRDCSLLLTNPLISPVPPTISLPFLGTRYIRRLVMSSAPTSPTSTTDGDECIVMAIATKTNTLLHRKNMLFFCKPGDESWEVLDSELKHDYTVAYSSKDRLFYCIDGFANIETWDLRGPSPLRICIDTSRIRTPNLPVSELNLRLNKSLRLKMYLVVDSCSGDVLLVWRYTAPLEDDGTIIDLTDRRWTRISFTTLRFDVYKLSVAKGSWDPVECLRDRVVFVGLCQPFILSAQDFPPGVVMPNSIYFSDDVQMYDDQKKDDVGIYNLRDFTVAPLFPSHHPFNNIPLPPIWFTPNRCYN